MISHVIRYNATDVPFKQAIFSQNKYPNSKWRYDRIADYLNLGGDTEEEKVEKSIAAVEDPKRQVDIPSTIQEAIASQGMSDDFFFARVEEWLIVLLTISVPEQTPAIGWLKI